VPCANATELTARTIDKLRRLIKLLMTEIPDEHQLFSKLVD